MGNRSVNSMKWPHAVAHETGPGSGLCVGNREPAKALRVSVYDKVNFLLFFAIYLFLSLSS